VGYLSAYRVLTLTLNHFSPLNKKQIKTMKAFTKTAFFFAAMIALATGCSKKTETTETNETTVMTDTTSTMMADSTMATDSASTMMSDSAQ